MDNAHQLAIPLIARRMSSDTSPRIGEPVTVGVPFPRGATGNAGSGLLTSGARAYPAQCRVLQRWPDGSVRWALFDAQIDVDAGAVPQTFTLTLDTARPPSASIVVTAADGAGLVVDTGAARFTVSAAAPLLLAGVSAGSRELLNGGASTLRVVSEDGETKSILWDTPRIEEPGAPAETSAPMLRTVVRVDGRTAVKDKRLELTMRLEFFAGLSTVRTRLTIRNASRAEHPRGYWELGDTGSIVLKELALVLAPAQPGAQRIEWSAEPGSAYRTAAHRVELTQESSGGEQFASTNHVDRHGRVPTVRGYRGAADGSALEGRRATPVVALGRPDGMLGAAVPQFWENFPRAIAADPDRLVISYMPAASALVHELQGGEQKTHECYLLFGADRVTASPLDWCRARTLVHPTPDWYASAEAVRHLCPAVDEDARYRALVDAAIEGPDSFLVKRERCDEYGWRHFGDVYGDHEAVFHDGSAPLISHYNNQYDPIAGFLYQFMRTGDPRWWTQTRDLAAHVIDIDVYHTDEDKSAYNHGLFWHTVHYVDAGASTHRTYPRAQGSPGGGPSAEHNYPAGLALHYLLTGDLASRDTAIALAQFVVDMDDGRKTVFRWLDRGATGVASASRTPDYHGPGRGSGNSLNALIVGFQLSSERRFLQKAEELIRRCTHPRQPLEPLQLLDAENRWFYTMYLQSLGRYLELKIELGELDAMYAYGRDVLLHYARWMADHERPYLERPEQLEYPTETWPAQDIRKSEVFDYAAQHAPAELRQRLLERAASFYEYSVSTLATMPTRTLARPVILMLVHGLLRTAVQTRAVAQAPPPDGDWQTRWRVHRRFVPQKTRATRRAIGLAVAAALLLAILGASVLMSLLGR